MNLISLSDEALFEDTHKLIQEERRVTTLLLHHLREVERRRLFADRGFSSLFDYLVRGHGYSEAAAQRRIAAMRLLKEVPEIEEKIQSGALSLTVLSRAQSLFRQEKPLTQESKRGILKTLEHKSTREAERELLRHSSAPEVWISERVRPVTQTSSEVRFVADEGLLRDLEKIRGLLAHSHPNMSLAEAIQFMAKLTLQRLDPARTPKIGRIQKISPAVKDTCAQKLVSAPEVKTRRRTIPEATRRAIWRRDGGRCSYKDPVTGRECGSRHALQAFFQSPDSAT